MPQRVLLKLPPEPPPPTARPTPASSPPNPPLHKSQNSESNPYHGREATAKLHARFVSHLVACSDVSPHLYRDMLPPVTPPPLLEPPPGQLHPRPHVHHCPRPLNHGRHSPPTLKTPSPHKSHADNPQASNVPDPPTRQLQHASRPRHPRTQESNAVNASAARSQYNHHPASTRNRQCHHQPSTPPPATPAEAKPQPQERCHHRHQSPPNVTPPLSPASTSPYVPAAQSRLQRHSFQRRLFSLHFDPIPAVSTFVSTMPPPPAYDLADTRRPPSCSLSTSCRRHNTCRGTLKPAIALARSLWSR
ncbi:hypothetical protein BC826DRAFT_150215 [Russula brevipes]|nr:hypothetical protein BC826DRAFT_150215 [Russula brevipes]